MSKTKPINIVVISSAEDISESLIAELRRCGHAARSHWLPSLDKAEALRELNPEILLLGPECKTSTREIVAARDVAAPRVSLVAYRPGMPAQEATEALLSGVQAVVAEDHVPLLAQVILRELEITTAIRARSLAEEQLLKLARRHRNLMEETSEAVAYLQEGIHLRANRQYAKVFGYETAEELAGIPLMDLVESQDRARIRDRLKKCERGEHNGSVEAFKGRNAQGENVLLGMKMTLLDSEGDIPQIEILIPNEAPGAILPSTGVSGGIHRGRSSLIAAMHSIAEHGTGSGICALVFLAVDNLSGMEERLGILATDRIGDELAAFVLDRVSDSDRVFRFSSHQLAILLFRPNVQAATAAAEDLREAVNNRSYGEGDKSTSLSVSGTVRPLGGNRDAERLVMEVRQTVDRIQRVQRSGFTLQEDEKDPATSGDEQMWLARVRDALENNSFRLAFQKISSLEGGTDEFLDVFLRMVDDKGDEILAGAFIPVAERHGLMPMVDQWVIRHAATIARQRSRPGQKCIMLVRLSASTVFASDTLLAWMKKFLDAHKGDPPQLTFTIKESTLLDRYDSASQMLSTLRKMGCRCAVSNFSGSDRAMELLNSIDLDFIKLQASFTKALTSGEDDGKIENIIQQVRRRDVKVVAEHVEDATAMAQLWQMGVHYVQGDQTETI